MQSIFATLAVSISEPILIVEHPLTTPLALRVAFCLLLFVIGAIFGSFLCCQARRLRRRETGKGKLGSRSVCLHCRHQLSWYENLPLFSWLWQRGKCRHCGKPIGTAEFLSELLTATAFALLAATINLATITPLGWATFAATILFTLILIFLAIYDGLYGELPGLLLTFSIICAILITVLRQWTLFSTSQLSWSAPFDPLALTSLTPVHTFHPLAIILPPLLGALVLGGLYLLLYLISKGKWVGDGDWLLGLAIGLALGTPLAAFIALFVANFSACLVAAPAALKRKNHQIYFGPFLVAAYIITLAFCAIIEL